MKLLFDPDLTTATGIILFISYFINILTNFSFFFSPSVFPISHHSPFVPHRVMLLTTLASVATHPGCHSVTLSQRPGFYFTVDSHWYTPPTHPSPCLPASPSGSSDGGSGFIHCPAVSAAARSFSSAAEGRGAAEQTELSAAGQ